MEPPEPTAAAFSTADVEKPVATSRRRPGLFAIWIMSSVVLFAMIGLWSLATPLYAGPDEGVQVIRAVSLLRGELAGPAAPGKSLPVVAARVPRPYAEAVALPRCFMFRPWRSAGCAPRFPSGGGGLVSTTTYVGHYPPLYYALVGTPSYFLPPVQAVLAMRMLSDLVSAAALGLAFAIAGTWSSSVLLPAGLAVSVTPMAIFLGGMVNPSGMEISLAVLCWTAALVVATVPDRAPPVGLLRVLGVAASLLAVTRFASPLWVACVGLVLLALTPPARLAALARSRPAIRWAAAVIGAASACAVWDVATRAFLVTPAGPKATGSTAHVVEQSAVYVASLAEEVVGVLGWLDTRAPFAVYVAWSAVAVAIVAAGAALGSKRGRTVLVGLVLAGLTIPTAMVASHARQQGLWLLQGRDVLPLLVGLPLTAAVVAGQKHRRLSSVLGSVAVGAVWACLLVFFAEALRRYTVGVNGPLDPLVRVTGGWTPPLGAATLLFSFTLADGAYLALGLALTRAAYRPAAAAERRLDDDPDGPGAGPDAPTPHSPAADAASPSEGWQYGGGAVSRPGGRGLGGVRRMSAPG